MSQDPAQDVADDKIGTMDSQQSPSGTLTSFVASHPKITELNETFQAFLLDMLQFSYMRSFPPHIFSSALIPETYDVGAAELLNTLATLISREIEELSISTTLDDPHTMYKESLDQAHLSMLLSQIDAAIRSPAIVSPEQRRAIEKNVDFAVFDWLKRIFRIDNKLVKFVHFHGGLHSSPNPLDHPLIPVLRSALDKSSINVIASTLSTPVIYIAHDSSADEFEATVSVCWPLVGSFYGLQNVIFRRIPCLRHSEIINVELLRQTIIEDIATGNKRPCLIVAKAGTPVLCQVDDINSLRTLADRFELWLHLTGPVMSLLIASETNADRPKLSTPMLNVLTQHAMMADSLETSPGRLLGISALPNFTFFFTFDPRDKDPLKELSTLAATGHLPSPVISTGLLGSTGPAAEPLNAKVMAPGHLSISTHIPKQRRGSEENNLYKQPQSLSLTIPIWIVAQTVGATMIEKTLKQSHEIVHVLSELLVPSDNILVVNPREATAFTLVVRFHPFMNRRYFGCNLDMLANSDGLPNLASPIHGEESTLEERMGYFNYIGDGDMGTKYLYSIIAEDMRYKLGLDMVSVSGLLCIRYRPLAVDTYLAEQHELGLKLAQMLITEAEKIDSAAKYNHLFEEAVSQHSPTLRHLKSWSVGEPENEPSSNKPGQGLKNNNNPPGSTKGAGMQPLNVQPSADVENVKIGLGGIRYTPLYVDLGNSVSSKILRDLDYLNGKLADELAKEYGAQLFSRGQSAIGILLPEGGAVTCVRVGLDSKPFTPESIKNLVHIVYNKGAELEHAPEHMQEIANVIRDGIFEAERELKSEADVEGLLRSIPIFGSLVSYIAPEPPKIKNRVKAFTISSGFSNIPLEQAIEAASRRSTSNQSS